MNVIVAPRCAAHPKTECDCCRRWRRCASIHVDRVDAIDVRRTIYLCSGCSKAAWDAAKKLRKGERP